MAFVDFSNKLTKSGLVVDDILSAQSHPNMQIEDSKHAENLLRRAHHAERRVRELMNEVGRELNHCAFKA